MPALLAAEDGRGGSHGGIDWFSIARAVLAAPTRGRINGLSTIEQQLARVLFPRRPGKLFENKLFELRLALGLARSLPKRTIWTAYLELAHYGKELDGYVGARAEFCSAGKRIDPHAACCIVACLKYPRSIESRDRWSKLHEQRVRYIKRRIEPHLG